MAHPNEENNSALIRTILSLLNLAGTFRSVVLAKNVPVSAKNMDVLFEDNPICTMHDDILRMTGPVWVSYGGVFQKNSPIHTTVDSLQYGSC